MKICIVSSCGGHLIEVRCLKPAYKGHERFYVLNDKAMLPADMQGRTNVIAHSERDWEFFLSLCWEAFQVLRKEKPDVILSTGAGPAVPFAIVGRLLFGIRAMFVKTIARIGVPSLTGRMMHWLAHDFFYQWETLHPFFPKARYGGPLV